MKKIIFILSILFVLIPSFLSVPRWDDDLHYKYIRGYHGHWVAIYSDFSHFLNLKGEYCRLIPKVKEKNDE